MNDHANEADDDTMYQDWIAHRRTRTPVDGFTDRVMNALPDGTDGSRHDVQLVVGATPSWPAQFAACATAMLVGGLPFLFVARAAKLLIF